MQTLDFTILYVTDLGASIGFYANLIGRPPIEASPTFAMFTFDNKVMLGLWSRDHVIPPVTAMPGSCEFAFVVPDAETVDTTYANWVQYGVTIAQEPMLLDFGYSIVVADPDGHRLRVMQPIG